MHLGLYALASTILMAIIGIYIYTVNPSEYSLTFSGIPISLPVAIWVMIPMLLLMIASMVHMMFYGTKNFFRFKKWEKDTSNLNNALYWALLNEPKVHKFNLQRLKETASILQVSNLKVNGTIDGVSEKIQSALNIISEIEHGKCVNFKEKKLAHVLSDDNPLVIQNHLNCLKQDELFIEEVLQQKDKYAKEVFNQALTLFVQQATFFKARKYSKVFDRENFVALMSRVTRDNDLGLKVTILDEFVSDLHNELKCSDFLLIGNMTKKQLSPDENLKLFKGYNHKYPKSKMAYLYLLFEYEMIDKAGEYLEEHDEDEFMRFRALYDLKKQYTKYKITDLMNIKHICNDLD